MSETDAITNKSIFEEIVKVGNELKNTVKASEARILLKLEEANNRINKLEWENTELQKRIEQLETEHRKKNIVIYGLKKPDTGISPTFVCNELKRALEVDISAQDIDNAYYMGKSATAPIKVEFTCLWKKIEVLRNCPKLKGTNIRIHKDLTPEQRRQDQILRKHLKAVRQQDCGKAYIRGNNLYVDGKQYTADELETLEYIEVERKTSSEPTTPLGPTRYLTTTTKPSSRDNSQNKSKEPSIKTLEDVTKTPEQKTTNLAKEKLATQKVLRPRIGSASSVGKK